MIVAVTCPSLSSLGLSRGDLVLVCEPAEDANAPGRVLNYGQDKACVPSSRSAVKKSHARMAPAWGRKNCDQASRTLALSPSHPVTARRQTRPRIGQAGT
jgi:hypothetical protein